MNKRLKKLYQTIILQHHKAPFAFEKREDAQYVLKAYNPICGDRFDLFFDLKNGAIDSLTFHGFGCAISKASSSILVKHLKNKPIEEALFLCEQFEQVVELNNQNTNYPNDDFEAFSAAKEFPGRLQCATLSWGEIKQFLEKQVG